MGGTKITPFHKNFYSCLSFLYFQHPQYKEAQGRSWPNGWHQKAEEHGCTVQQLKTRTKSYKDNAQKFANALRSLPSGSGVDDVPKMAPSRKFAFQHFEFMTEKVVARPSRRGKSTLKVIFCFLHSLVFS